MRFTPKNPKRGKLALALEIKKKGGDLRLGRLPPEIQPVDFSGMGSSMSKIIPGPRRDLEKSWFVQRTPKFIALGDW